MPNHCENDLYIGAPNKERLEELLTFIGANKTPPEFDFNLLIPYPAEYAQRDEDRQSMSWEQFQEKYGKNAKDGFNMGGYEWCISNWGTKWGAYDITKWDGRKISFLTAWSPPSPNVLAELHKKFPNCELILEYFEGGCGFSGGYEFLPQDCSDLEEGEWKPGIPEHTWSGEYHGRRGG